MKNSKDILMKFISTQGYKRNSPDVNRPLNVIPSGRITMQDVDFPVRGVDNLGNEMFMVPGGEYFFPGDYVVETPMMQRGGLTFQQYYTPAAESTGANYTPTMTVQAAERLKAMRDAQELARRKQAIQASQAAASRSFRERLTPENLAQETGATGDKLRFFPNDPDSFIDDYLNPLKMVGDMASGLGRIPLNVKQGNYGAAALDVAIPVATGALAGLGAKSAGQFVNNLANPLAGTGQFLTTKTPLKNAYKYNPWAFKPNPEAYYRGVGKEGVEDALKTGLIRSKNTDMFRQPYFARPGEFETALYYNPEALIEAKGFDVLNLKEKGPDIDLPKLNFAKRDAGALPVTPKYAEGILGKPETKDWYFDWDVESIPVNHPDIKLLQKDWLRGYKEVSKPASSESVGNIFFKKTPIPDWAIEKMNFLSLPELNNPQASEVLENFRTRIGTPEGKKRLKELGITNTEVFDNLKILRDENTLGHYWYNRIGLHPKLPEVRNVTRHEIEHGVQDAVQKARMNKFNRDHDNFKYLFSPKKAAAARAEALKPTSDIDDILSGLELRKKPEKVDWNVVKSVRENPEPHRLFEYMSDKQRATNYFDSGSQGREKSTFLAEVQQYMMDQGTIPKTSYIDITPEMVRNTFIDSRFDTEGVGKSLRLFNIMKPTQNNYKLISKGLNKMLSIAPYAVPAAMSVKALQETPQYQKGGQHGGLDRWFAEKWVDIKTGKECGRQEGEKRAGYPACRPSKRVSEDTPKTASELSSAEKEKFKRSKTSSERISYQHKRKQDGGEWLNKYENTKENRQKVDQLFGPPAAGNVDYVPAVESVVGGFSAGLAKSALAPVVKSNLQSLQKYMEMQDSPFAKIDLPVFNEAKNWLNKYDEGGAIYTVKKGDTLSKIAAENKTTVNKIVQANNIKNPNIIGIDQKLVIPQGSSVNNAQTGSTQYVDWSEKKNNLDRLNNLPDEQLITGFYSDKPEQTYLVVDKKNAQMKVYKGDKVVKTYEVGVGANPGDAQTVTKIVNGKADWSAGNKSTGAGAYTISNIDPASKAYYGLPSFNLKNDRGIEVATTIHGTPAGRRSRFDNDNVEDNRMSYGCINGKCFDLKDLQQHVDIETPVYVLPEDEGNRFQIVDGKPVLKVSAQNRAKYNSYVDATGKVQKGQGANQSVNTLSYSPIKAVFDENKFKEKVFSWNDLNDEKEYVQTTKPFYNALVKYKQSIMKNAKIPSDVYNELARMAFGIYGTESNFGDTHSTVGNFARASAKFIDSKNSSSPDYKSKATTYGANEDSRSVGLTQIRWNYLNKDEKQVLNSLGITSNMDFMDPEKAAIGTVALLGVRYNQQLTDDQKRDIWSHLPSKWNRRGNYGDRVKQNASYLNFKEATNKRQTGGQTNWLDNYNDQVTTK
jgi:murein DD-endopeptidase MepM/ murein hydrolase activator NlpD